MLLVILTKQRKCVALVSDVKLIKNSLLLLIMDAMCLDGGGIKTKRSRTYKVSYAHIFVSGREKN